MKSNLNLSLLEGRLTKDPELFFTKKGIYYCTFYIAVSSAVKDKDGGLKNFVSFIEVQTYRKIAEVCAEYLKKGNKVRVKGKLKQSSWTDPEGNKKSKISIEADSVDFLGTANYKGGIK